MVMDSLFTSTADIVQDDDEKQQQQQQQPQVTGEVGQSFGQSNGGWGLPAVGAAAQAAPSTPPELITPSPAAPPVAPTSFGSGPAEGQGFIDWAKQQAAAGNTDPNAPTGWDDFNYGLNTPGRLVSKVPYFDQQPEILQSAEKQAANSIPWVLATGGGGVVSKAVQVAAPIVGGDVEQLLNQANPAIPFTDMHYKDISGTPFGGPVGIASSLLAPSIGDKVESGLGLATERELTKTPEIISNGGQQAARTAEEQTAYDLGHSSALRDPNYGTNLRNGQGVTGPDDIPAGNTVAQAHWQGVQDARAGVPNAAVPAPTTPTEPPPATTPSIVAGSGGGARPAQGANTLQEIAYAPFGFDASTALRQDATRFLNPFRAGETQQVIQAVAKAQSSPEEYANVMQDLTSRAGVMKAAQAGVKIDLADWTGKNITDREINYSKLLDNLPGYQRGTRIAAANVNARRLIGLDSFVENNPNATTAQMQTYANYLERVTGRGTIPSALQPLGPVFTSLRFAASIPERAAYLIPWTRLADGSTEMFGPIWREAVKDHAGFVMTIAGAMAAAQQAGLNVGWKPNDEKNFGLISYGNTHVDLTAGSRQYINMVMQAVTGEKNGKSYPLVLDNSGFKGAYQGTIGDFIRNKLGPSVGIGFAAAKAAGAEGKGVDYVRPDYYDQGVFGIHNQSIDHIAQFVTPLWVQDVANAIKSAPDNQKLTTGAVAAPLSFFGAGVNSYEPSNSQQVHTAATTPEVLQQAYPNHPEIAKALEGKDWNDLLPSEKKAVTDTVGKTNPQLVQQMQDDSRKTSPGFAAHSDALDQLKTARTTFENRAFDDRNSGKITTAMMKDAIKTAGTQYYDGKAKADADPAYMKELAQLQASGQKSSAQQALENYYTIGKMNPDDPGKAKDDEAKYLAFVHEKDPVLANRLVMAIQQDAAPGYEKMYQDAKPLLDQAWADGKTSADRTAERKANPTEDALLNYFGREYNTLTPEADRILQQMMASGKK